MIKKYKNNSSFDIITGIKLIYLISIIDLIGELVSINLPLLRYMLVTLGSLFVLKGIFSKPNYVHLIHYFNKWKFLLFFIWTIVMIVRGLPTAFSDYNNYIDFKRLISGQLLWFLIPFFIFYKPNLVLLKQLIKFAYNLALIYLFITIPLLYYFLTGKLPGESFGVLFAAGASIIVLTFSYHSRNVQYITLFTFLLVLFINAVLARRNQIVYFGSILFFSLFIQFFSSSRFVKYSRNNLIKILFIISIPISLLVAANINRFDLLLEKSQTGMESRDEPIKDFFADFSEHPNDWIFGRGINGRVQGGKLANRDDGTRSLIENGYLQHILVGGWIYLGLIILIALPAIYLGCFRSRNVLSKAFAAIILTYFIDMVGFGLPSNTIKFVLIWIGIGFCYSARIRNYPDEYLKSKIGIN